MRGTVLPDPATPNRRPTVVEAGPGAGDVNVEMDDTRQRLAPDEAQALSLGLLAGAPVADPRFNLAGLDFGDEVAGVI